MPKSVFYVRKAISNDENGIMDYESSGDCFIIHQRLNIWVCCTTQMDLLIREFLLLCDH